MKITKHFDTILILILSLNALFLLYVAFFKKDAIWLETLKAGGAENFALVEQLYTQPAYISQQTDAIKQGLQTFGIK